MDILIFFIINKLAKPSYPVVGVISVEFWFDDNISDILYLKNDMTGRTIECIRHKSLGIMPLSTYGDGIKKILYILNKLFTATDSILLIDEIETGLHKQYYDSLFPVIFALASKLNVQLFIATHSIEVIDAILKYGNYENNNSKVDPIKVITLKKIDGNNGSNIVARNVTGKYVYENRKVFEFLFYMKGDTRIRNGK